MKTDHINCTMLRLRTTSECLRAQPGLCPVLSVAMPAVPSPTTKINVRFVPDSSLQLKIKQMGK